MKKSLIILLAITLQNFYAPNVSALDFVNGEDLNTQVKRGYKIEASDTLAGHPIYAQDGDWTFVVSSMGQTTGGDGPLKLPSLVMIRFQNGKWAMIQSVTVTSQSLSNRSGWMGDPCAGDKIVKINIVRGRLDRCATAQLINKKIGAVQTETLEISFLETNFDGRFYQSIFDINYANLGLSYQVVTDTSSDFNRNLKEWMNKFLLATVRAADYSKPADAFKDVPTFSQAIGRPATPATSSSGGEAGTGNPAANNISERLRILQELFNKNLITKDDYEKKRTEIIQSL